MFVTIKSEFRKLLSVRSTYLIALVVLALEILICWWVKGYRVMSDNPMAAHSTTALSDAILTAMNVFPIIYSIAALLLITHEYRYNTITYTLTASRSRTRVIAAKLIVLSVYALACGAVFGALAPLLVRWGMSANHVALAPQSIVYSSIVWRALFTSWAYVMLAAVISLLVRNQVGSFAVLFLVPGTVENLLSLWLHKNVAYLPFTSIGSVVGAKPGKLSFAHAALVGLAWVVGGAIAAWALFQKRDAN